MIQSLGSRNISGATTQPCRTPAMMSNQSDIWPSTWTQLTELLYRSSRASFPELSLIRTPSDAFIGMTDGSQSSCCSHSRAMESAHVSWSLLTLGLHCFPRSFHGARPPRSHASRFLDISCLVESLIHPISECCL